MLRTLLEDRFKLKAHFENRSLKLYELRVARSNGKLGPQLQPTKMDCKQLLVTCGFMRTTIFGDLEMEAIPMTELASRGLSLAVDGLVVDKTNLSGLFDVKLRWTPEHRLPPPPDGRLPNEINDADRPSIFTAVQEQLGLTLVAATRPVQVLVIDSVELPMPD